MADFQVMTYPVKIVEHPDADALEIAEIGDYKSCVKKGYFKDGETVAYIPENAVVPKDILETLGLVGLLSGKKKNKVKAKRLRGILSQGIIYPTNKPIGEDVSKWYGITKYIPPIPETLRGNVDNNGGKTLGFDIENIKRYPDVLQEDEQIRITEKIHGTWTCLGLWDEKTPIVTSKGLSSQGLTFKVDESNQRNTYVKMWDKYKDIIHKVYDLVGRRPVYFLGESYGKVQDLRYDLKNQIDFRVFDIYVGHKRNTKTLDGKYLNVDKFDEIMNQFEELKSVPVIFDGPYMKQVVLNYSGGKSEIASHIREGVVVKPAIEREDMELGRVILKSINEDYLLRKGSVTEFE